MMAVVQTCMWIAKQGGQLNSSNHCAFLATLAPLPLALLAIIWMHAHQAHTWQSQATLTCLCASLQTYPVTSSCPLSLVPTLHLAHFLHP